ncbi:SdrD B-like domain-containing protein [Methanimicrococcus hacksteinii]|uniref:SdrD B-like domain-containing protein n=1 Tax=Methanimicrococcus hacksteinii TaxID=3028293 RepID=UPI00298F2930|nr:SdrD B-like domain-containing protein [Methanimicrococcus sp. At1]
MLLLAGSAAAANDDYTIEATWSSGTSVDATEMLQPKNTSTLTYKITQTNAQSVLYLVVDIKDIGDGTFAGENSPGFTISDYPKKDLKSGNTVIAKISGTSYSANKDKLIIPISDPSSVFSIDLVFESNVSRVYHNETNTITAQLYKTVEDGVYSDPVSNEMTATVQNQYPYLSSRGNFILMDPSAMPSGASDINARYVFYTTTEGDATPAGRNGSIWNGLGARVIFEKFTLDFSNVEIKAGDITQTYSEWDGSSPVSFSVPSPAISGYKTEVIDNSIVYTPINKNGESITDRFIWCKYFNFSINTTGAFVSGTSENTLQKNAPYIDFEGLEVSAVMKINGRGPSVEFTNVGSDPESVSSIAGATDLITHYTRGKYTGSTTEHTLRANIIRATASYSNYTMLNSEQYKDDPNKKHLYYQELFKTTFTNTLAGGSNERVKFAIPDGITVTHIRLPSSETTDQIQFSAISIYDYEIEDFVLIDTTVSKTHNLSDIDVEFKPGEDVILKIDGLVRIFSNPQGSVSYNPDYTISFVGTTNETAGQNGAPLRFEVFKINDIDDTEIPLTNSTVYANDDYIVMPYVTTSNFLSSDLKGSSVPTMLSRGDEFYMYTNLATSRYPYYSTLRSDPETYNGIFSNPVVYFSVPAGLEDLTPMLVDNNGNEITDLTDVRGHPVSFTKIVHENAGLYKNGKLIEVKFHLDENAELDDELKKLKLSKDDQFWITNVNPTDYDGRRVILPVKVPEFSDKTQFEFGAQSVLVSTWEDVRALTSSSGGRNYAFTEAFLISEKYYTSGMSGVYHNGVVSRTVSVQTETSAIASVGVKTGTDQYSYYNPQIEDSYPTLKAGSSNEEFKLYFYNGLGESIADSVLYFILPNYIDEDGDKIWGTALNSFSSFGDLIDNSKYMEYSDLDYTIYYTTHDFGSNIGSYDLEDMEDNVAWIVITEGEFSLIEWDKITAIKCEFDDIKENGKFTLKLPFNLPAVSGKVKYDQEAVGQTLYSINNDISSKSGLTAAVKLSESDKPIIRTYEGDEIKEFSNNYAVDYLDNAAIPAWYQVVALDDFTSGIELSEVSVKFKDGDVGVDLDFFEKNTYAHSGYADGTKYTYAVSEDPLDYINASNIGTYTVKYTTKTDGDQKSDSVSFTITVKKDSSTVVIDTPSTQEIYMNMPVPDQGWVNYFSSALDGIGTDIGNPILPESYSGDGDSTTFTSSSVTPDTYYMGYSYADVAGNVKYVKVPVVVKYKDNLSINATGGNSPISGLAVNVLSVGTTEAEVSAEYINEKYVAPVYASKTTPDTIKYKITYSGIPVGLIDANNGVIESLEAYSSTSPINYDLALEPVKMTVDLNDAAKSGVKYISLYKVQDGGDSLVETIEIQGTEDQIVFDKESGWFDDEKYYMTAELYPGYIVSSGCHFVADSSILQLNTDEFELDNDHVEYKLDAEQSTLISGTVWNDANKDSFKDDPEIEFGIAGVTVQLLKEGDEPKETVTGLNGEYYFIGLDEGDYIIQVLAPSGYQASDFIEDSDQSVDKDNELRSELITLDSTGLWAENIDAGFYKIVRTNEGGPGYGQARVVSGSSSGGTQVIEPNEPESGFTSPIDPTVIVESVKKMPLFVIGLIILAILLFIGFLAWNQKEKLIQK